MSMRIPRTQRSAYTWPRPGSSAESAAANAGDPMSRGGGPRRTSVARAAAIVCAVLFFVPTVLSFVYPNAFLYTPHQLVYERMLGAVLAALALSLLLSMRDPMRNAGVYAVVGLVAGTVDASAIYSLIVDGGDVAHWFVQVPLLPAIAA